MNTASQIIDLPGDAAVRRILVVKWSAMGDMIIASAMFEDIRRAFPDHVIHLNTLPAWEPLFAADPRFDRVFAIDMRRRKGRLGAIGEWLSRVRETDYDLVIDLQSNDRTRILLSLLWLGGRRIRWRIGNQKQLPYNLYPVERPPPPHAAERMRAALRAAGIATVTPRPVLHLPARHAANADRLMTEHRLRPDEFGVFFPGCHAAGHLKRWGAGRYAALARQLHEDGLANIVLIGAADEIEECRDIAAACGPWGVNLCGQTEVFDIVPLCRHAKLIVSNDTGTAHVASACETPMVVICGPTDPRRVKPLGDNVMTLQADLPCINCYRKTCSHHSCMPLIKPSMVRDTLGQLSVTAVPKESARSD